MRGSMIALALAVQASSVIAQNYTLLYNNTQIDVQTNTQYSGNSLIGYHVGAALSYIVARAPGYGNSFGFNVSATSAQLLNNDIAPGYQLPCYVVKTTQISNNSGPLECGAGDQTGYYDVAQVTLPNSANPGTISFNGINQWYVCAVQSFTYGWVQGTIVGLFGGGVPLGPGVTNCTLIDALAFAVANEATTTSTAPTTAGPATSSVTSPYFNLTTSATVSYSNSTATRLSSISSNSKGSPLTSPTLTTRSTTFSMVLTTIVISSATSTSAINPIPTTSIISTVSTPAIQSPTSTRSVSTVYPLYTPPASSSESVISAGSSAVNPIGTSLIPSSSSLSALPVSPSGTSSTSNTNTATTPQVVSAGSSPESSPPSSSSSVSVAPTINAGSSQTSIYGTTMTTVAVPYSYNNDGTSQASGLNTVPTTAQSASFNSTNVVATYSGTGTFAPVATYIGTATSLEVSYLLGLSLATVALFI